MSHIWMCSFVCVALLTYAYVTCSLQCVAMTHICSESSVLDAHMFRYALMFSHICSESTLVHYSCRIYEGAHSYVSHYSLTEHMSGTYVSVLDAHMFRYALMFSHICSESTLVHYSRNICSESSVLVHYSCRIYEGAHSYVSHYSLTEHMSGTYVPRVVY